MKLSLVIAAVDRASSPLKRITAGARRLASRSGLGGVRPAGNGASGGLRRVGQAAANLTRRLGRASLAVGRFLGRAGLRGLQAGALLAARGIGGLIGIVAQLAATLVSVGGGLFVGGVFSQGLAFEQLGVVMETLDGSAEKAGQSIAWLRSYLARTPGDVDKLSAAFLRLKQAGIDPAGSSLDSLTNASFGMGKDIGEATEAYISAVQGNYDALSEGFGISAEEVGKKVVITYQKAGKKMRKEAGKTAKELEAAFSGALGDKFAGANERQAKTMAGMWQLVKNQIASLQLDVANAGIFDLVKGKLGEFMAWLNVQAQNGELKRWATEISAKLVEMATAADNFIRGVNWSEVASALGTVVRVLAKAVGLMARLVNLSMKLPFVKGSLDLLDWATGGGQQPSAPAPAAPPVQRMKHPTFGGGIAKPAKVAGQIEVTIRAPVGLPVSTSARSTGPVKVKASRGRSMAGAA